MALKNNIQAIPYSRFTASTLDAIVFKPFPAPLPHPCFMIRIINRSNRFVYISYDGVHYHDGVFPEEQLTLNWQQFSQPHGKVAQLKEGTVIYLSGDPAGATGYIYLCGYFQESQ